MSEHTFTPGDQEHTTETITDIDGEVYPGETLKLKSSMTFYSPEPDLEDAGPVESDLYLYDVTYGAPEQKNRVEALRLLVVDPMGHDSWVDVAPAQLQQIGEWLIREAQGLNGSEASSNDQGRAAA